jgi:hypothetical protein
MILIQIMDSKDILQEELDIQEYQDYLQGKVDLDDLFQDIRYYQNWQDQEDNETFSDHYTSFWRRSIADSEDGELKIQTLNKSE